MRVSYEHEGQTIDVQLERQPDGSYRATVGERAYTLHALPVGDGVWALTTASGRAIAHVVHDGAARFVSVKGQQHAFKRQNPDERRRQRHKSAGADDLNAQMPGQVVSVHVSEGETVAAGQVLVILEAMKMEIRVSAPAEGVVKRCHVAPGAFVERGQTLIELETRG